MESIDDDFGDLYADVEVQASSAIGTLYIEPEDNSPRNGSKSTEADEKFLHDSVMEDSDSEDDLNIVLNDDDCDKFLVTGARSHGGGYEEAEDGDFRLKGAGSDKILRRMEPAGDGSELNSSGNGVERGTGAKLGHNSHFKCVKPHGSSISSMYGRGNWEDDVYKQKKFGSLVQVANRHASTKPLPHQFGYGFSLPWYRTILNVNIDALEEKPWRHPGVDTTDFFNFGFNEDSWKRYCNSLAYEAEAGHEIATQDAITEDVAKVESSLKRADRGERLLELPKGRAIQVEDSINERQPSMDLRRPHFQDSDVIIQITVHDSTVDSSDSAKEEVGHGSKSEVSESGKLDTEDDGDVCFSVSASSDELSGEHLGRSLRPTTASNQNSLETDNHDKDNLSDVNWGCHQNMDVCISEGIAEAAETKNQENEVTCRNIHRSDPFITETEPSHDNRSHFSPTLSFSESDPEDRSEDSVHAVSFEIRSPLRRQSLGYGTELQNSIDHKSSRSDGRKTKSDDGEDFSVHTSPMRDKLKHESWRHRHYVKQRILLESDDDTYQVSDAEGDLKRYQKHGNPVEEEWKHHRGRPHGITDRKIYLENCYESSPLSNAWELCDKDYSSVYCGRWKERPQDLGYHDREGSLYYKEKGPCVKGSKRFDDGHLRAVNTKAHLSFKEDSDQFVRNNWNRKEFYDERRADIDKEDDMDGFWYHGQRLHAQQGLVPRTYRQSGRLVSRNSSASTERDIQWRRGNDRLQLRKKTDPDDCPLDYKLEDEWLKQKYGTSISFTRCKRGMVEPYERCIQPIRREFKASGKKGRYVGAAYFHRSWPMESEDEYQRHTYGRSLALATDREPSIPNGRRWYDTVSSRNEAYDSKIIERYHRHWRMVCHEEDRDSGWFGSYNYTDENDLQNDNQVQSRRRGLSMRSRVLHWREDKLLVNDRLFAQGVSFSSEKGSKHDLTHVRHGSLQDEMLTNDLMLEHNGYKMVSEGSNATCLRRNSIIRYRGEHEQKVLKDRDSVDVIVGEGKSSGRHSNGRSLICNARLEKMGLEYPVEQKSLREFNDSCGSKAVNTEIPNTDGRRNKDKQLGKFSVTECNQDLDIEEGQVICTEQSLEDMNLEKENASETMMGKVKMRTLCVDNASDENRAVGEYDNKRVLETLAKMEKRRERFKDPITIKREQDKTSDPQVELLIDTKEIKQQRPARKRQWGVS
ncbi:FIP1[III]-like protein isoform X2 [Durio zibethinus]|uniref:FIP1[III]-like protein isoform X2 n=1 Tax=Durio zibethinus TaxID=66656 RepID=A0A6P5X208_DURZI|nr:FIP1[III]-like protein isoform X2 [Durio zibethinus]